MKIELGSDRAVIYPCDRLVQPHLVGYDDAILIYVGALAIDHRQVRFMFNGKRRLPYFDAWWQVALINPNESLSDAIFEYLDNFRDPAWLYCTKHEIEEHIRFATGLGIGRDGQTVDGLIGVWHDTYFRKFEKCSLEYTRRK